ncbi:MAG: penicillin-binding transpeptidase domain-containing protein [Myxococcales bacterium]
MKPRRILRVPAGALLIAAAAGLCFAARGAQEAAAAKKQAGSANGCAIPDSGAVASCTSAELSGPIPSALDDTLEGTDELDDESAIEAAVVEETAPAIPAEVMEVPAAAANAVVQHAKHPEGLSLLRKAKLEGKGDEATYTAELPSGRKAALTVNPHLQEQMQKLFALYKPMQGAMVAIDPKTGKILAMAEYDKEGQSAGLATRPLYPAASVFKIITGAALLEKGISPDEETCYHGGLRGIVGKLLEDKPRVDRRCLSLSMALAKSANVVFAKMAVKHLDGASLREEAERFLFNRPIWDQPVEQSSAAIPDGRLEFAKSAAGFGQVKLSPMHAALIAAAVGNGGIAMEPTLIDRIDGQPEHFGASTRLLKAETAAALRDMMKNTVSSGTATASFRERGRPVLGDIEVAGKTGSLSNHQKPFKDYSWFVGFAPADDPQIAVAAVVVNGLKWTIHAPYVAREAMRAYLVGGSLGQPPAARSHRSRRHRKHH